MEARLGSITRTAPAFGSVLRAYLEASNEGDPSGHRSPNGDRFGFAWAPQNLSGQPKGQFASQARQVLADASDQHVADRLARRNRRVRAWLRGFGEGDAHAVAEVLYEGFPELLARDAALSPRARDTVGLDEFRVLVVERDRRMDVVGDREHLRVDGVEVVGLDEGVDDANGVVLLDIVLKARG